VDNKPPSISNQPKNLNTNKTNNDYISQIKLLARISINILLCLSSYRDCDLFLSKVSAGKNLFVNQVQKQENIKTPIKNIKPILPTPKCKKFLTSSI
ncbi:hypothetical protein, partial [Staphylococcus xylosus]|uniref:hypothetical protein n=1 Tax=Staphylococcus xylosus TaxID=1288 RepID=UPI001A7E08EA